MMDIVDFIIDRALDTITTVGAIVAMILWACFTWSIGKQQEDKRKKEKEGKKKNE